ncbi:MAG: hypothetical protein GVY08_01005 [Bacteroidetes bacterium]|jgi:hypothetical protein|nr:hypothetical protein [Bacteroidota bacterium]
MLRAENQDKAFAVKYLPDGRTIFKEGRRMKCRDIRTSDVPVRQGWVFYMVDLQVVGHGSGISDYIKNKDGPRCKTIEAGASVYDSTQSNQ